MTRRVFENAPLRSLLRDQEVLEGLRADAPALRDTVASGAGLGAAEGMPGGTGVEREVERLDRLLDGNESVTTGFGKEEAIILERGRPPLLIQGGKWEEPRLAVVRDRLEPARELLLKAIPKVGRVELINDPTKPYVGTGWMMDEDVLITNRHVAREFVVRSGSRLLMRTTPFGEELKVQVDFNEEFESPNPPFEVG